MTANSLISRNLPGRRQFVFGASAIAATAPFGSARAQEDKHSPNFSADRKFGPARQIECGLLNVGYVDLGPQSGPVVLLLHGWPYDISSYREAAFILADRGYRVVIPHLRGFGTTHFLSPETFRNGQPAAFAADVIALMNSLKIESAVIGGFDWGARTADIIACLYPERCDGLVAVSGYLIGSQAAGRSPLPPNIEYQWWYQFYFSTDRGRHGYASNRREFARLIWRQASPNWKFDEETFDRAALSFDNADHVDIVIHNYRWRLGLAAGEPSYDAMEKVLSSAPHIRVPTITLEGDANSAPHPEAAAYANNFVGPYEHKVVTGGIGHNLPQEAPLAFAEAVMRVKSL